MTDPKTLLPADAIATSDGTKFKPKLEFHERCAILALVRHGVRRDRTALAFGVDRRTVSHICNESSRHYRDVRKHMLELGKEAFIAKYLTEDAALKVRNLPPTQTPGQAASRAGVSSRANRMAGTHTIPPADGLREYPHAVQIVWQDGGEAGPGWYYVLLDDEAKTYYHNGDESRKTSQACLAAIHENLTD